MSNIDTLTPLPKGRYTYTNAVARPAGVRAADWARLAYRTRFGHFAFEDQTRRKIASLRSTPDDVLGEMMQRDGDRRIRHLAAETWLRKRAVKNPKVPAYRTDWEVVRTSGSQNVFEWLGSHPRSEWGTLCPEARILFNAYWGPYWDWHQKKDCACSICVRPVPEPKDEPEAEAGSSRLESAILELDSALQESEVITASEFRSALDVLGRLVARALATEV